MIEINYTSPETESTIAIFHQIRNAGPTANDSNLFFQPNDTGTRRRPVARSVVATPENENNEIGVAKFLLSLEDGDERVAIVEFGARKYRDLDPLVRAARPNVGVLTNIGEAHLEIIGLLKDADLRLAHLHGLAEFT